MQSASLIDELEDAIADKRLGRRAEILRRVTDLFKSGSGSFSEDQIGLFDEVMSKLLEHVELSAIERYADPVFAAPHHMARQLQLVFRYD
jgi:hypothetical protein